MRAKLAAIANLHLVTETIERLEGWLSELKQMAKADEYERTRQTMRMAVAFLEPELQPVSDEAQMLLGALSGNIAFRIARAFKHMQQLHEGRAKLEALCLGRDNYSKLRAELERVFLRMEGSIRDLKVAGDALHKEVAF